MSEVKLAIIAVALAVATGSSWCGPPPECRPFLALARDEQVAQFRGYPAEKQLDAYLCTMRQEPPDLSFADLIADRGPDVIPPVVQRLKSTDSEGDKGNLIYLLEVMSERGYLRDRTDVVAEISQSIDTMKSPGAREEGLERLKKIQINSHIKPFTYVP